MTYEALHSATLWSLSTFPSRNKTYRSAGQTISCSAVASAPSVRLAAAVSTGQLEQPEALVRRLDANRGVVATVSCMHACVCSAPARGADRGRKTWDSRKFNLCLKFKVALATCSISFDSLSCDAPSAHIFARRLIVGKAAPVPSSFPRLGFCVNVGPLCKHGGDKSTSIPEQRASGRCEPLTRWLSKRINTIRLLIQIQICARGFHQYASPRDHHSAIRSMHCN